VTKKLRLYWMSQGTTRCTLRGKKQLALVRWLGGALPIER
jgi:hypothetical protein